MTEKSGVPAYTALCGTRTYGGVRGLRGPPHPTRSMTRSILRRVLPLATAIGRFPEHRQRLPNGIIVDAIARSPNAARFLNPVAQHPDRVLAVIAAQGHEPVEDMDSFTERRPAIPHLQRCDQLFACSHADLPCHVVLLPPDHPAGSKLREATGQHE